MDAMTLNTIVGAIGIVVGAIGIIVGIIGGVSLHKASSISNIKASGNSRVNHVVYNGLSYGDVDSVVDSKMKQYNTTLNSIESVNELLKKNDRYAIPVIWSGSQKEFDLLEESNRIDSQVVYYIND